MYAKTSNLQEGFTCKDSHAKCFKMTNSTEKLYREAMLRSDVNFSKITNFYTRVKRKFY